MLSNREQSTSRFGLGPSKTVVSEEDDKRWRLHTSNSDKQRTVELKRLSIQIKISVKPMLGM